MNNYNDKKQFGGGGYKGGFKGGFGGKKSFGGRGGYNDGPKEMFTATCASCGKTCEVPFRPNGVKPVYCTECFAKNGGPDRSENAGGPRPFAQKFSRGARDAAPRFDRPAPAAAPTDTRALADLTKQVETLNAKLDRVIALAGDLLGQKTEKAVPAVKAEKAAPAKKASKKKAA